MRNGKIGHIILKGGTIEDLQREFSDFPSEPTTEYFIELGYTKSTAKQYFIRLRANTNKAKTDGNPSSSKEKQQPKIPVTASINPNMEEETQQHEDCTKTFLHSAHANFDNILVDTCALAYSGCVNVIQNAKQVTFIFSTLKEMDKKQYEDLLQRKTGDVNLSQLNDLAYNVRKFTSDILENPDRYMLSSFSGYDGTSYVDDTLLQYLSILPKQIRPTLLTVDKNLAAKAQAMDLDYIINIPSCSDKCKHFVKHFGYGIKLYKKGGKLYIHSDFNHRIEITHAGKMTVYDSGEMFPVVHGDSIRLHYNSSNIVVNKEFKV